MSVVSFDVQTEGMDSMIGQLETIADSVQDGPGLRVMEDVGKAAMADIDARFDTGGYGTWVPLSPLTIALKGGRTEILIDTGNMRNSVGISQVNADSVIVTVPRGGEDNDPAVPIQHQLGTDRIPQRKIVEDTPELRERLSAVVNEWIQSWG